MCGIFFVNNASQSYHNEGNLISHRGPDNTRDLLIINEGYFQFHRLAIHGLTVEGDQPLQKHDCILMCNGEIYNYKLLSQYTSHDNYNKKSDCEIILDLYQHIGCMLTLCNMLDGVFAFVLKDLKNNDVFAARDPIGVRPLFYGYMENGSVCFSSEMKSLVQICTSIKEFPPGSFYYNGKFTKYINLTVKSTDAINHCSYETLRNLFIAAVEKRLDSERPVGFFLSGGLDSSLVCAVSSKLMGKQIHTFSIGIKDPITGEDSPDMINARKVAEYINSKHTEIYFTTEQALSEVENVIYQLESYDCTTIRASVPMYLLSKYVAQNTDFKVILSGEGADELFGGYLYFHKAPSLNEFQDETQRLLEYVHKYDVLRADKCTAGNGLELRVPFFDKELRNYVSHVHPIMKQTTLEKEILRDSFKGYLPESVRIRQKNGMSDAVGYSWVDFMRKHADSQITDTEFTNCNITPNKPLSKEELYYRKIYEKYYPGISHLPHIWRPKYTDVVDPSARLLDNFAN